ncbi:MAG: Bug family tripartite tricarboxylate transporter substrate binding protein [Burkholderiales bacterium]
MHHLMIRSTLLAAGLAAAGAALAAAPSSDPAYPTRPVRMTVTFPPGGGADFVARILAQHMTANMGQQVVVENRPGADGTIGVQVAARATPDGYTVVFANNGPLTLSPILNDRLQYDPLKDLSYISLVIAYPFILAARPSLPVKSTKELIELARAQPGTLNFGSSGTITRLAMVLFQSMTKTEVKDIPFNGNGPTIVAVLGSHVDLMLAGPSVPQLRNGQLKSIAVTGARRSGAHPDVPTLAESGLPGYDVTSWAGVIGPRALPPPLVTRLHGEISKTLKQQDVRERIETAGLDVVNSTPAEFTALVKTELKKWATVVPLMKK